jgi:hypothetical protein
VVAFCESFRGSLTGFAEDDDDEEEADSFSYYRVLSLGLAYRF